MRKLALISLLAFHALPALYAAGLYGMFWIWLATMFSVAATVWLLGCGASKRMRLILSVFSALVGLGAIMLMTSLHLQADGFNARFFYHFDLESLKIGLTQFPLLVYGATAYVGLAALSPWLLPKSPVKRDFNNRIWGALAALVTLAFYPPLSSAMDYLRAIDSDEDSRFARREPQTVQVVPFEKQPKNLILIYAESLERQFFDEDLFPNLMPELSELRRSALEFTHTQQVAGTGWTIAGIVASQCSLPFNINYFDGKKGHAGQEAHVGLAAVEKPFANEVCLGDIAKAYGYNTVFMGGAPVSFAGKGKFLRTHGFDEVYGFDELKSRLKDWTNRSGWGILDDTLLGYADEKVTELEAADQPYLLSVLTVDTHQPKGHVSSRCEPFTGEDNPILHALSCSDDKLGDFISAQIARNMDDTVIVLFSDHLALRNTVYDRLIEDPSKRMLSWLVWDPDRAAGQNAAKATHFDVGPTLAELMNIPNYRTHNFGRSVLDGETGYWFSAKAEDRALAKKISYLEDGDDRVTYGVKINPANRLIHIGSKPFEATRAGFEFAQAFFMLALDDKDRVDAVMFSEDYERFQGSVRDRNIIAVSYNPLLVGEARAAELTEALAQAKAKAASKAPSAAQDADTDNSEPDTAEAAVKPLYYYIGNPSKGKAVTGLASEEIRFSARDMRAILKEIE